MKKEAKTTRYTIWLTPSMHKQIGMLAKKKGMSVNQLLTQAIEMIYPQAK